MPHAICNTCSTLFHWPHSRRYTKHVCECGSEDLTQVRGHLIETEDGLAWEYVDRRGVVRQMVLITQKSLSPGYMEKS